MHLKKLAQGIRQAFSVVIFKLKRRKYEQKFSSDTLLEMWCDGDLRAKTGAVPFSDIESRGWFWR